MSKNKLYFLGLLTLFGMGGIGVILIEWIQNIDLFSLLEKNMSWYNQLIFGLFYGFITAWLGWKLIKLKLMNEVRNFYSTLINQLNLTLFDIIFISLCAGIGEELLFRGAIQYWLGIFITSIIFVAIHGYLNPKDWKISLYGTYLTFVMIGISLGFEQFGLIFAVAAHFAIDVYLLSVISLKDNKENTTEFHHLE